MYIGKTNNIERRNREHKSMAYNPKSETYNNIFEKKIRQYGFENFDFKILEITDENHWEEKEKYWIKYYNTFEGVGYNMTEGGDRGPIARQLLDEQDVREIYDLLLNSTKPQYEIAKEYEISQTLLSNINLGLKYCLEGDYKYPLRKNYKTSLKDYKELIDLLINTDLSYKEIAKKLNMAESTVKKINYGKLQFDPDMSYPIRKKSNRKYDSEIIKDLLLNTNMTFSEIAETVHRGMQVVQKINNGDTYYDEKLHYPLRKPQ